MSHRITYDCDHCGDTNITRPRPLIVNGITWAAGFDLCHRCALDLLQQAVDNYPDAAKLSWCEALKDHRRLLGKKPEATP